MNIIAYDNLPDPAFGSLAFPAWPAPAIPNPVTVWLFLSSTFPAELPQHLPVCPHSCACPVLHISVSACLSQSLSLSSVPLLPFCISVHLCACLVSTYLAVPPASLYISLYLSAQCLSLYLSSYPTCTCVYILVPVCLFTCSCLHIPTLKSACPLSLHLSANPSNTYL